MKKLLYLTAFVLLAPVAWLIVVYADEYLRPYRKYEVRKP